eukprot:6659021-Prymnesium_polylepis.1
MRAPHPVIPPKASPSHCGSQRSQRTCVAVRVACCLVKPPTPSVSLIHCVAAATPHCSRHAAQG